MTTDHDLLALIEKRGYESLRAALSAVVELHKPREREVMPTPNDPFWYKVECSQCIEHETQTDWIYAKYPCPTIQAIEKELG